MTNRFVTHTIVAGLLALVGMNLACGGGSPPSAPTPLPPNPTPNPTVAPLQVASISPTSGVTGGATTVQIVGAGLQSGATATFDGAAANVTFVSSAAIVATTPVHTPGVVDIVVTNPDGQAVKLTGAYTYASPESFDFNGTWVGYALAHPDLRVRSVARHADMEMRFTIDHNLLTSVTCGAVAMVLSPPPAVSSGAFSLAGNDGVALSGRIVSDGTAVGAINTSDCPATRWVATRR